MKLRFTTVLLALLLLPVACATTKTDWERAVKSNSIPAYGEFLKRHPQSQFSDEASLQLDMLSFNAAKTNASMASYEKYLRDFPEGRFVQEAKSQLDALSFNAAKTNASMASYEKYLRDFPEGRFVQEARSQLDLLSFKKADAVVALYEEYLAKFPNGTYANDALRRISYLPLMTACAQGNTSAVDGLLAKGSSLSGFGEASIMLMSILQKAAGKNMQYLHGARGEVVSILGVAGISPEEHVRLLNIFKLMLRSGADPNAMRIKGFNQGGCYREVVTLGGHRGTIEKCSGSEKGEVVPAEQDGVSAFEFAETYKLNAFRDALLSASRNQ